MEGIRESKEEAMEKEKERTGTDGSQVEKDGMPKSDGTTDTSQDGNDN